MNVVSLRLAGATQSNCVLSYMYLLPDSSVNSIGFIRDSCLYGGKWAVPGEKRLPDGLSNVLETN